MLYIFIIKLRGEERCVYIEVRNAGCTFLLDAAAAEGNATYAKLACNRNTRVRHAPSKRKCVYLGVKERQGLVHILDFVHSHPTVVRFGQSLPRDDLQELQQLLAVRKVRKQVLHLQTRLKHVLHKCATSLVSSGQQRWAKITFLSLERKKKKVKSYMIRNN